VPIYLVEMHDKQLQKASAFLDNFERSFENFLSHQDTDDSKKDDNVQKENQRTSFTKQTSMSSAADLNSASSISKMLSESNPNPRLSLNQNPLSRGFIGRNQADSRFKPNTMPPLMKSYQSPSVSLSKEQEVNDRSKSGLPPLEVKHKIDKIEKEPRRFQCNVCPKSFKQAGHLKEHQMSHSGIFPYNCEDCKKGFRRETSLLSHRCSLNLNPQHQPTFADNKSKGFGCDQCGRTYASKHSLSMHKCIEEENRKELDYKKKAGNYLSKDKTFESVIIDVPVEVASSEVVFDKKDGTAFITGTVIELDTEEVQLEDADVEGYEVEVVNSDCDQAVIHANVPELSKDFELPCAFEMMSKDTGLSMKEITDLFSDIPDQILADEILKFPWQGSSNDRTEENSKFNSLQELPNVLPTSAGQTSVPKKRISMNNFTYFNDKSAVYMNGSGDDTDDEDWSISTKFKCHPCKKDFASSGQLKKHNKQHIGLNNSNSAANKALKNAKLSYDKQTLDNSLLLQEDEDEEEEGTTKKPSKSESKLILFSTLA